MELKFLSYARVRRGWSTARDVLESTLGVAAALASVVVPCRDPPVRGDFNVNTVPYSGEGQDRALQPPSLPVTGLLQVPPNTRRTKPTRRQRT